MAVDEAVVRKAQEFTIRWNERTHEVPFLVLDGTWPSVGVIDRILFPLRKKSPVSIADQGQLGGAAAYLALLAADCWSTFGIEVSAGFSERGVYIEASGGNLDKRHFRIGIEEQLARILTELPNPLPVLAEYERATAPHRNLVSLFALGVMTGLSPYGEGAWLNETTDTAAENIVRSTQVLGASCVRYYERLFPDETYGQVGEIYLRGLIFPPAGMNEPLPAETAVRGLGSAINEFKIPPAAAQEFCLHLALSPDELLSSAGLAAYAAIVNGMPHPAVLGATDGNGSYGGLLRPSAYDLRKRLGLRGDWITATEHQPEDVLRFRVESALGMLPWVKMSAAVLPERVKEPRLARLLEALSFFDFDRSVDLCDRLIAEQPATIEYRLQRVYLDIVAGEFERAVLGCRAVATEPGAEGDPKLYALWGIGALSIGHSEDALRHLKMAFELAREGHPDLASVANDYGYALLLAGQLDQAAEVLDVAVKTGISPLTAMLNRTAALRELQRLEEAAELLRCCVKLAPLDYRVFVNALSL